MDFMSSCDPSPIESPKSDSLQLSRAEWASTFSSLSLPAYRSQQVADWVFKYFCSSPDNMTNLSKDHRTLLKDHFNWATPEVVSALNSDDGSTKLLLKTSRGQLIESVILRYDNRVSLCVSSQVGCKMACSFCQTGKLGFMRHLSAHEIISQFVIAAQMLRKEGRRLSHVVFMGMGEPLDNYENVKKAVELMISPEGFGLSRRHVTISTSGLVDKIDKLTSDDLGAALAVSLHAANDTLRSELMPINRKYPLAELKESLLRYQRATGDKVTIEYILIRDKNASEKNARELVTYLSGLSAKVNLIPFNAHPGLPYERPSDEEISKFQAFLAKRSIAAPVRYSKGLDVSGACGQLAAKTMDSLHLKPERSSLLAASRSSTPFAPSVL
jgi:23S rRNA (adenine2503-C2)-methyltransferase